MSALIADRYRRCSAVSSTSGVLSRTSNLASSGAHRSSQARASSTRLCRSRSSASVRRAPLSFSASASGLMLGIWSQLATVVKRMRNPGGSGVGETWERRQVFPRSLSSSSRYASAARSYSSIRRGSVMPEGSNSRWRFGGVRSIRNRTSSGG